MTERSASEASENLFTHWLRFENYDMPSEEDVEVMSAQNISAVKDRVEFMGYSGFCIRNNIAYVKNVTKHIQISDLDKVDPSCNVAFYVYCIDASQCLSNLQVGGEADWFGEEPGGCSDFAAEDLIGARTLRHAGRRQLDSRESTDSHREVRILARNFLQNFIVEADGSENGGPVEANDHSQAVGRGEAEQLPRRRRRSCYIDLFGPPSGCKNKQALQQDIFLSTQDVSHAVMSARKMLKDDLDKDGMSPRRQSSNTIREAGARVVDTQSGTEQRRQQQQQPPARGLDSLLRTSLRCAMRNSCDAKIHSLMDRARRRSYE